MSSWILIAARWSVQFIKKAQTKIPYPHSFHILSTRVWRQNQRVRNIFLSDLASYKVKYFKKGIHGQLAYYYIFLCILKCSIYLSSLEYLIDVLYFFLILVLLICRHLLRQTFLQVYLPLSIIWKWWSYHQDMRNQVCLVLWEPTYLVSLQKPPLSQHCLRYVLKLLPFFSIILMRLLSLLFVGIVHVYCFVNCVYLLQILVSK